MKKIMMLILIFAFGLGSALLSVPTFSSNADVSLEAYRVGSAKALLSALSGDGGKDITLISDIDMEGQTFNDVNFTGSFNGNGYTISNVAVTSSGENFGIFATAKNAVIKNLRLAGTYTYNFNNQSKLVVGALVGKATATLDDVSITNCEIDVTYQTQVGNDIKNGIALTNTLTFGNIAGVVENVDVTNCINYSNANFVNSNSTNFNITAGGLVGHYRSGEMTYSINYGSLANETGASFTAGGLAGEVNINSSILQNLAFTGNITSAGATNNLGGVAGEVNELSKSNKHKINYAYFTADLNPFAQNDPDLVPAECKRVNSIGYAFFQNGSYWRGSRDPFDFAETFINISSQSGSRIHLQVFQSFTFSLADSLKNHIALSSVWINGGIEDSNGNKSFKYGSPVEIHAQFKAEKQKYYYVSEASIGQNPLAKDDYNLQVTPSGEVIVTINSSYKMQGSYSLTIAPVKFSYKVETSDASQGSVKKSSSSPEITYFDPDDDKAKPIQVSAEGLKNTIYTFDHWELYQGSQDESGEMVWTKQGTFDQANNSTLEIKFGQAPFNDNFKLVAYFTDAEAMRVSINPDAHITSVKLGGSDYNGEAIPISPDANSVQLIITVENGYVLDVDAFLATTKVHVRVSDPSINRDNELEYKFILNMSTAGSKELTLSLTTISDKSGGTDRLLWLWITLPIVVVLVGGGLLAFFLIRRKMYNKFAGKQGKAPKQKKEKSPNYKDLYY